MKRLFLLLIPFLSAFSTLYASPTGSLAGYVKDTSGNPIVGATIRLAGTRLGGFSKVPDGHFLIHGIPVGKYSVEVTAIGFAKALISGKIISDSTTQLSIVLTISTISSPKIVAIVSSDMSWEMSSQGISSQGVNGFSIRGGRADDRAFSLTRKDATRSEDIEKDVAVHPDSDTASSPDNYDRIVENAFISTRKEIFSTFSIDVDAASYTNVRRFIEGGTRPPRDAVRIEEMINYFHYDLPEPADEAPFSVTTEVATCPWNQAHRLVRIGLQGRHIPKEDLPPANLVFLIDVSGSMMPEARLPLIISSLKMLVNELRDQDRVAIVTYAGNAGLVLPSTPGSNKAAIDAAIDRLTAGGSTAGGEGILLAYNVARANFLTGGNNRVILATDGDFNVGISSEKDLDALIENQRNDGIYLTVLGVGDDNFKDSRMEQLADHGNGNYYYLDGLDEAKRILVGQLAGTLFTIAKDVKIQVEFNPERVESYRLIGYENRALATEDFTNDRKDAGELGAGHCVTALYEITPGRAPLQKGNGMDLSSIGDATNALPPLMPGLGEDDMMAVRLRYKPPTDSVSLLITHPVTSSAASIEDASADLRFAAAVAELGLILRKSAFKGEATVANVLKLARSGIGNDTDGRRAEFITLVEQYHNTTTGGD